MSYFYLYICFFQIPSYFFYMECSYILWQCSCATFAHYLFQNAIILVNITSQKGQHPNLSSS